MWNQLKSVFAVVVVMAMATTAWAADKLALIGKIPGEYVGESLSKTYLGVLGIENELISKLEKLDESQVAATKRELEAAGFEVIVLKNKSNKNKYDVIYPGLIDLHGHNKQNMMPTWAQAKGQFANRFEWRKKVSNYKEVLAGNMNPWSSGSMAKVAAYRWAELQAMTLGTTYLQGYMQNHKDFGIHNVEDSKAYKSKRKAVSGAGDIIDPDYAAFLWNHLRPVIEDIGCLGEDRCYGRAVKKYLEDNCSDLPEVATGDIYTADSYKWLMENEAVLSENCDVEDKESFLKYFTDVFGVDQHKNFIARYMELQGEKRSALVTHIAEGRRHDPYNSKEFKLLHLGGLAIPGVNLTHAVGLDKDDFKVMAKNDMGIVWSPYSNFLLYGETLDLKTAAKEGVLLALGSDWTPTGSKGVLEELKLAYEYLKKAGLSRTITTTDLYYMVTKNPAKMINHYGFEKKGEHGIGTLEVGAMGTVIVASEQTSHPHKNLVVNAEAEDINLVVVDGRPVYGNKSYLKRGETISGKVFAYEAGAEELPQGKVSEEELGKVAAGLRMSTSSKCGFKEEKVFVQDRNSYDYDSKVGPYLESTGLNLDTFEGVNKFLAVAVLSQSENAIKDNEHRVRRFNALYGCEDDLYKNRLANMVKGAGDDEYDQNAEDRLVLRIDMGLYSFEDRMTLPHELAELYNLEYEARSNYVEEKKDDAIIDVILSGN